VVHPRSDKGLAQIEHGDVLTHEAVGSSLEKRCQGTVIAITGAMLGLAIALLATRPRQPLGRFDTAAQKGPT
jgi:hypothetical protein